MARQRDIDTGLRHVLRELHPIKKLVTNNVGRIEKRLKKNPWRLQGGKVIPQEEALDIIDHDLSVIINRVETARASLRSRRAK